MENIFVPLQMNHTHFHDNFKEIVPNRASAYGFNNAGKLQIEMGVFDVLGDGAVYTNILDLFKWDQNYYHNILGKGGQELIQQQCEQGILNNGETIYYARGLIINPYRGLCTVSHGGRLVWLPRPITPFSIPTFFRCLSVQFKLYESS